MIKPGVITPTNDHSTLLHLSEDDHPHYLKKTDSFTVGETLLTTTKSIKIGDDTDSVTIAKKGLSYIRATPNWVRKYIDFKNLSTSWIAKDSTNAYYFYIGCVTSAPSNASFFIPFPEDYIANSQFKIYLLWGANSNIAAGKTTTFIPVYGIHRIGSAPDSLIIGASVAVGSPHVENSLIDTLLATVTPTDTEKNDILQLVLKTTFSDTVWARFFYSIVLEYQSNK